MLKETLFALVIAGIYLFSPLCVVTCCDRTLNKTDTLPSTVQSGTMTAARRPLVQAASMRVLGSAAMCWVIRCSVLASSRRCLVPDCSDCSLSAGPQALSGSHTGSALQRAGGVHGNLPGDAGVPFAVGAVVDEGRCHAGDAPPLRMLCQGRGRDASL